MITPEQIKETRNQLIDAALLRSISHGFKSIPPIRDPQGEVEKVSLWYNGETVVQENQPLKLKGDVCQRTSKR